jgi:hypothetical protein
MAGPYAEGRRENEREKDADEADDHEDPADGFALWLGDGCVRVSPGA